MRQRISAGVLAFHDNRLLLVRHSRAGSHDFWCGPGGGVEGAEELYQAAEREAFEETGIIVRAHTLAYIDELIDSSGRAVKFWFLAEYISGEIDTASNPAKGESIVEAGWFSRGELPKGHVFPEIIRNRLWADVENGIAAPFKLPLRHSIFT